MYNRSFAATTLHQVWVKLKDSSAAPRVQLSRELSGVLDTWSESRGGVSTKGQTFDDLGPLPPGWKTRMDPVKNRRFYYNRGTNQTQWTRPKDPNSLLCTR